MHSIRTKATILNVIAISVAMTIATVIGVVSISKLGHETSEQSLHSLCNTGKNNVNYYLKSVEQSVNTVSSLIDDDLDSIQDADFNASFDEHMERMKVIFNEAAVHANGVFTYYYRPDPAVTAATNESGFWFTNLDGKGFQEHEVTDISDDKNECLWFYRPKEAGAPIWLPPYVTDNLDVYVLSYNVPIYRGDDFIGVVGIELDYKTLGDQIKDIKVLEHGYAFILESDSSTIIYHPYIDILGMPEDERPHVPDGFNDAVQKGEHHLHYRFYDVVEEGDITKQAVIEKHAYWTELSNDMIIVVAVPVSDIMSISRMVIVQTIIVGIAILVVFILITAVIFHRITKPLKELTLAAEDINNGNYVTDLSYSKNDEIGVLTKAVKKLVSHLGEYIADLNSRAFADALTSVANKSAFDVRIAELQQRIENGEENLQFAVAVLDCDDLKKINDEFGHDKGNVYLQNSSNLICRIFQHSEVFRIGGDEFAVILTGEDYEQRRELELAFITMSEDICSFAKEAWEKVRVSIGVAEYDREIDSSVDDVVVHADHLMYQNKRKRKKKTK